MGQTNILLMEGIKKYFGGVRALDGVHFELNTGEIHALVGENGAGKTTLMNVLLGSSIKDAGRIVFKGKEINFKSPADALASGISMIHQEIRLIQQVSVAENIWLGREKKFSKFKVIRYKLRLEATRALLKELGLEQIDPLKRVNDLSVAQMQLVELARAVSYDSDIIIMDEPTSALTTTEIEQLYKIVRNLSKKGTAVIFISHKLDEILSLCDKVTVMRDGHTISTFPCGEVTQPELIRLIVGRNIDNAYVKSARAAENTGEPVLEVKNLCRTGVFEDISFSVRPGEVLGFSGLMGAGRSEIMRAIFGIDAHTSGTIIMNGKTLGISKPRDAVLAGMAMVTEDRLRMGVLHSLPVLFNTTIAAFKSFCTMLGLIKTQREMQAFRDIVESISVKYHSPYQKANQLSGGNQQKIVIARWLLCKPDLLILDEPTRGIDVGAKSEIYKLIDQLAQEGMAIILVSSDMPEILGLADRVIVIRNGRIVYECLHEEANQETIMSHAFYG